MSLERIALAEMLHEAECACGYLDQSYVDQADDLLPLLNARIDTAVAERLAAVTALVETELAQARKRERHWRTALTRDYTPTAQRIVWERIAVALSTAKEATKHE